jgi:hypothetical protein
LTAKYKQAKDDLLDGYLGLGLGGGTDYEDIISSLGMDEEENRSQITGMGDGGRREPYSANPKIE